MPNPSAPRNNGHQEAPDVRKHTFDEVAHIFTEEEAQAEANRCLQLFPDFFQAPLPSFRCRYR